MENYPKNESFTFKVTISARSNPELFAELKDAGPYYRAKIMLPLAQLGLSIRNGDIQIVAAAQINPVVAR